MCHIAWQGPMHVGHMASHVCGTWQAMCMPHGKPCVCHMACHVSSCMALLEPIYRGGSNSAHGSSNGVCGGRSKEKEEEGKGEREERKREREERKGEREEKRKGKKKREEKMGGREEKERGIGRRVAQ